MRISICIPQYNRSAYLLQTLESIRTQTYPDVEVVVADDCSTDDTEAVVPAYLEESSLSYKFFRHPKNLGYDANLRSALEAATGDYLLILGNDDALRRPETLANVAAALAEHGYPAVAFGNCEDYADRGAHSVRARATEVLGHGVDVALRMFRSFSCVAGVIFERKAFHRFNTDKYDRSVYVQMYLAPAIIASGGNLLTIAETIAVTGLHVSGQHANGYAEKLHEYRWRFKPSEGGLDEVGRVVCDAIIPFVPAASKQDVTWRIFRQLLVYSYPFWLYSYRKHGEYWASLNLAFGCFSAALDAQSRFVACNARKLLAVYAASTAAGLTIPLPLLDPLKEAVRWTSRRFV